MGYNSVPDNTGVSSFV